MADSTSSSTVENRPKGRGDAIIWPIVIIIVIFGGWYGFDKWQFDDTHIYTDNAQISGRIYRVLSPEQGYVEKLHVENNEHVESGQLLVKLSDEFYQWEVERAQAQYNILESQLGSQSSAGLNQAQLASAQANLEVIQSQRSEAQSASKEAEEAFSRKQDEFNKGDINQSQFNMAKGRRDQAQARLQTLQKEAYAAQQQVLEAEASGKLVGYNLNSAKAALLQAQKRLEYTSIRSPATGVVAQLEAEQGVLVQSAQYMMSVVSLSDVWVVANIRESDFLKVQAGATAEITIDAFPGQVFKGVVNSTSPATGDMFSLIPRNNASGNFIKVPAWIPVRVDFTGLPQAQYRLLPGMSAEVTITVKETPPEKPSTPAKPAETAPAGGTQGSSPAGHPANNPS